MRRKFLLRLAYETESYLSLQSLLGRMPYGVMVAHRFLVPFVLVRVQVGQLNKTPKILMILGVFCFLNLFSSSPIMAACHKLARNKASPHCL